MFRFPHEIYFARTENISLMLSGGKIKPREYSEREGYGVRVLRDKKLGFAYCERKDNLEKALDAASEISRFSTPTEFSFAPEADVPKIDIFDKKIGDMEPEELNEILGKIRDGAEKYSKNTKIMLTVFDENIKIENSEGFGRSYRDTGLSIYAEVMDGDGFGYYSRDFIHLPGNYYEMGLHAAEMAGKMKDSKKPKPGNYTVIMEAEVVDDIIDIMMPSFLGDWKRRGISILTAKKNEQFFDEKFSMYDDGTLIGTGGRPFDDEGTPAARLPLVENGVVRNFVYDRETAFLEGVGRSGQCNRSDFSGPPGVGYSNVEIATGDYENLEEELKNPIIIYSLHGTHTANRTTGDFGVEVNAGMFAGDKNIPVRGFMLTGNIFNLFKNIKGIEKKAVNVGSLFSPRIAFEGVRVVS